MIILRSPTGVTTVLPNPRFGNTDGAAGELTTRRAMDGTLYTKVKRKTGRHLLTFEFLLGRGKALELAEFYQLFSGVKIHLTDHRNRTYYGILTNTLDLTAVNRQSRCSAVIEFEGLRVS